MKIWAKYLIIGWSIVTVAISILSFQIMKSHFGQEKYDILINYKEPEVVAAADNGQDGWEFVGESLFYGKDIYDKITITLKEFVDRMKKAKGVTIDSKTTIKDKSIYLYLPLYVFAIWAVPILVFCFLGLLFSAKLESK